MRQLGLLAAAGLLALGVSACSEFGQSSTSGGASAQGSTPVQRPAAPANTP